jgi:3-carboxy-cis,cis-muconate cycloisomerase
MFDRHAERLSEIKKRVLQAQFGGAVGTLASLGSGAEALRTVGELAKELGLAEPAITWHVARDTIAETVQFLALLGGSLAKIADDVMLMSATEFGEAGEPFAVGRGASSTMPQKRNPISCGLIIAAARALRQQAGLALDAMVSSFERTASAWHLEWIAVPEAFGYAAGALNQSVFLAGGLIVDAGGMAKNLALTHGLIVAEAVMMGLAPHTGRNEAHDLVYDSCRDAIEHNRPLYDVLLETPEVAGPLGAEKLKALTDPANYLGAAQAMVDRVLGGR